MTIFTKKGYFGNQIISKIVQKKELINNATLEKLLDIASKKISRCFKEPEIIFELSMVLRDLLLFEGENTAQLQATAKETSAPKARFS